MHCCKHQADWRAPVWAALAVCATEPVEGKNTTTDDRKPTCEIAARDHPRRQATIQKYRWGQAAMLYQNHRRSLRYVFHYTLKPRGKRASGAPHPRESASGLVRFLPAQAMLRLW